MAAGAAATGTELTASSDPSGRTDTVRRPLATGTAGVGAAATGGGLGISDGASNGASLLGATGLVDAVGEGADDGAAGAGALAARSTGCSSWVTSLTGAVDVESLVRREPESPGD